MFAILFRPGAFDFGHPEPELDGDDRLLDRLRRLLLRTHLRPAPDLHRADHPAPRTPRRPAARRVRGIEGDRPRSVPAPRDRRDARCAAPAWTACPAARSPTYASIGGRSAALRGRGARPRTARFGRGRERRAGDARPADVVLPRGVVLRCHPPREPHGRRRRRPQRGDPVALGLRGHRSRPRSPRGSSLTAARRSGLRCSRPTATRAPRPPATYCLILATFAAVFLVATWGVLVRNTRTSTR